ncbi:MAG: porin family protein [Gallionella sp.]
MKLMNLSLTSIWILFSLLTAACGAYAQETGQKARQRSESSPQDQAKIDSYEKLLRDADAMIKSGKPAAAYALLEPLEFAHAGEVRFDYLIGTAALDSGKPAMATLAFERVLAVNPDFPSARLDMARAYYQLGDIPRAKTEFTLALKQNPSDAARASIKHYLDEIAAREAGKKTFVAGYVEGAVGHDSNVNSSSDQSQVLIYDSSIPAWRTATLDPTNVKASDNYYGVAAGGVVTHRQDSNWNFYAGADLRQRVNRTQKYFDSFGLTARAGMMVGGKANRLSFEVLGGRYTLGGSPNYDSAGLNADWRHMFSPSNQLNVFAQFVRYRFADPLMKPNDFNQQAMGFGWLHLLTEGRTSLSGNIYYGAEQDVSPEITVAGTVLNPDGGRSDGAKRFRGIRAGGQTVIGGNTTLFGSAGIQVGDYDKVNPYFLLQRHDRFADMNFGMYWHWEKLWSLRPQLNFFRNESNIPVYAYDRTDVSLNVRRDFR